jgi:hypothetical protein
MLNRDINVKLQGLKYNLEKVWGVFVKIPRHGNFWNIRNYFAKENPWNWSIGPVDRVHAAGPWVHGIAKQYQTLNP